METHFKTDKKNLIGQSRSFPAPPTASERNSSRITTTSFTRPIPKNRRGKMRISECGCLGSEPKELLRQREGPAVIFWTEPSLFHSTAPRLVKIVVLREGKIGRVKVSLTALASPPTGSMRKVFLKTRLKESHLRNPNFQSPPRKMVQFFPPLLPLSSMKSLSLTLQLQCVLEGETQWKTHNQPSCLPLRATSEIIYTPAYWKYGERQRERERARG